MSYKHIFNIYKVYIEYIGIKSFIIYTIGGGIFRY